MIRTTTTVQNLKDFFAFKESATEEKYYEEIKPAFEILKQKLDERKKMIY